MKRGLLVIMLVLSMSFLSGCFLKDDSMAEQYKSIAKEYVNQGKTDKAIEVLEEGYSKTKDQSLLDMAEGIEITKNISELEPKSEPKPEPKPESTPEQSQTSSVPDLGKDFTPVALNKAETEKLNIFLSNFCEAHFGDYDSQNYSEESLVSFAYIHNKINKPEKIKYENNYNYISADDVRETVNRFFGKGITYKSYDYYKYSNGYFYTPAGSGESYSYFSIVSNMWKNNVSGYYLVDFTTFWNPDDYELPMSECYSFSLAEASKKCKLSRYGTAVVREKEYNGKMTYELVACDIM